MREESGLSRRFNRKGRGYALIWLVYLIYPISTLFGAHFGTAQRLLGLGGLVLFVAAYLWAWWGDLAAPTGSMLAASGLTVILAAVLTALLGPSWAGLWIYASTFVGRLRSPRAAAVGVALIAAMCLGELWALHADAGTQLAMGLTTAMAGFAMVSFTHLILTTRALRQAQDEIARLATAEERLRIARDVHDLLGHSLSVIALKADLAGRLLATGDPARAAVEISDVHSVARRSLTEVREAVSGYRRPRLDEELARVREALEAAGIRCAFTRAPGALPEVVDTTLAWVVREAATNVVRHSRASTCHIRIAPQNDAVEAVIEDDGRGPSANPTPANGLIGLAERVRGVGGWLTIERGPLGGFLLRTWMPLGAQRRGVAAMAVAPGSVEP